MTQTDPLDRDTFKALREDAFRHEFHEKYGQTPAQEKKSMADLERRIITEAFETGDHKPDGTVLPVTIVRYFYSPRHPNVQWLIEEMTELDRLRFG